MRNPLADIGLNEKQEEVYRTLIKNGEMTISDLARKLGIKRPTLYLAIDELITYGLISDKKQNRKRMLSAIHPRRLMQIAKLKISAIQNLLPELITQYELPTYKSKIDVYQGEKGVKNLYEELYEGLSNKQEALFISDIAGLKEKMPSAMSSYEKILRVIRNPKIRELNVKNEAGILWEKESQSLRGKNHQARFLPTNKQFGATDICILGNTVSMFSMEKNDVFVVRIQSEQIARTYKALFEITWEQGTSK